MEFTDTENAISKIRGGSLLTFSGMELNRAPIAMVNEIVRQKKKDIRVIRIPNPLPLDILAKNNCVKSATFGFLGFSFEDGFVIAPNARRSIENGSIMWKETDILEIIQSLKSASRGLEEIELPYFFNTDYLKYNHYKKSKKGDAESLLIEPIRPDFALIHAQYADKEGNVFISDPLIDELIASASDNVIVSVEKIIPKLERITIPSKKIDYLAKIENGALPTSCFGFYDYDPGTLRKYLGIEKKINDIASNPAHRKSIDHIILKIKDMIGEGDIFATGVASPIPMLAAMHAKASRKEFTYINCGSGAINPLMSEPSYSSVTIKALNKKESFITLPDVWDYALTGKIDLMIFGAVQISAKGDINLTCIGDYNKPKIKLPGPAGAVTLRNLCKNPIILALSHSKKTFVEKVDFITSSTVKDSLVITNLGVLKLGNKPEILEVFPHSSVKEIKENTSFELDSQNAVFAKEITKEEYGILNKLDRKEIRYRF